MRTTLLTLLAALPVASFPFTLSAGAGSDRPNLLVLFTDDQRVDTIRAYDPDAPAETPHLDRLAREGVRFDNAFVTTPICVASRASVLTGRYTSAARTWRFLIPMPENVFADSYPMHLKEAGYFIGQLGKYGVGITREQRAEFDYFDATAGQGPAFREHNGELLHDSEWLTVKTGEFLDRVPEGQPFSLQVNYKAPHPSSEVAPEDVGALSHLNFDRRITDTKEANEQLPEYVRSGFGQVVYEREFNENGDHQPYLRTYYEKILSVDRSVGRILEMLEERGLAENTVIVFLSDHGTHFGERQLGGKWTPYDVSLRIPFIVYDPRPGARQGAISDEMVLNIDVAPSLLEWAGLDIPGTMNGRSLASLVNGDEPLWREYFFYEHYTSPAPVRYIPRNEGVRTKTTKFVRWMGQGRMMEEFYDLVSDPVERHNLIGDPDYREAVATARRRLDEWREANPSNFDYHVYGPRPQYGAPEIDWEKFREGRPDVYKRIESEVERLGVTWEQAVNDWSIRYQICSRAGYWY